MKHIIHAIFLGAACLLPVSGAQAQTPTAVVSVAAAPDYTLSPGDALRIQVFQNPDLTLETRVSESGAITYPLIGAVSLGGRTVVQAEQAIARALREGGFIRDPQVSITLLQLVGSQVAVLGQVGRPGRFTLETANLRLSSILAGAGGILPAGDDVVIVNGVRNGRPFQQKIDFTELMLSDNRQGDITLQGGDVVFVPRAPVFYIYGSAQRPGAFRVERGMTVMQALAVGGGPTLRGSETRLRLHRLQPDGKVQTLTPALTDAIQPNDTIFVRESLF